jgi:phage terminase large subunit
VIDPARTPNAHREFTNYQYATDRDGNFLSVLPDAENHTIDAVAYALDTVIYAKGGNKSVSA